MFPNFHESDFDDFNQIKELTDDKPKPAEKTQQYELISTEDTEFVTELHIRFMLSCTKSEWLLGDRTDKKLRPNLISPLVEKMQLCKRMLQQCIDCFNYKFDLKCLNALNVLVSVANNYGDVNFAGKYRNFFFYIKKLTEKL